MTFDSIEQKKQVIELASAAQVSLTAGKVAAAGLELGALFEAMKNAEIVKPPAPEE